MNYFFSLLYHNQKLTIILLTIICCAILFIILMSIMLFLDSVYRPEISQYPFNLILDRIIPSIALVFPSIIIFFLHPFETWFARIILLLVIHIFVLVPIFYYWSKLRNWHTNQDQISYNSWDHPRLYENIAIALIYPLLWGLYSSCSRFLRLGSVYNVVDYIFMIICFIYLCLFS